MITLWTRLKARIGILPSCHMCGGRAEFEHGLGGDPICRGCVPRTQYGWGLQGGAFPVVPIVISQPPEASRHGDGSRWDEL